MGALVIYQSMFGDNRQVAEAIAGGLEESGVAAQAVEVGVAPLAVTQVDLLVIGCPNHAWGMPRASTRDSARQQAAGPLVSQGIGVREWLEQARIDPGTATAAFDTRGSHPRAVVAMDHASTSVEKALMKRGGRRVAAAEHFRVIDVQGPLEPGEVERAHAWGAALARVLATGPRP